MTLHQAAQKAVEAKQREAFEHWYSDAGRWPKSVARGEDGHYLLAQTNSSYEAWRAAVAALQQQPEPVALKDGVPNTEAAIAYSLDRWGYRQGTKECIAFYRGACWLQLATPPALQHQEVPREPVAWMHEYTDPHTGERARQPRKNKPTEYEMLPGEVVTPLYTAPPAIQQPRTADLRGMARFAAVQTAIDSLADGDARAAIATLNGILAGAPALQHQEVPREPVAHFPIIYAILRPALSTGNIAVRQHAERLAETLEGDQLAAVRELLDRQPATSDPARVIHAASPSTTRQQEVGSGWKLVPVEPTEEMKAKCTDGMSPGRAELWWNDVFAPAYRAMLAAAPSTPEKAGGVPAFDPTQPCLMQSHTLIGPAPTMTYCQRCKNPHHACDGGVPSPIPHPLPAQANDGGEHG